jgi:hypothetical protein
LQRDLSCTGVHKQKLMQLLGLSRSAAFDSSICFVREFGFMAVSFFHLWLVFWERWGAIFCCISTRYRSNKKFICLHRRIFVAFAVTIYHTMDWVYFYEFPKLTCIVVKLICNFFFTFISKIGHDSCKIDKFSQNYAKLWLSLKEV